MLATLIIVTGTGSFALLAGAVIGGRTQDFDNWGVRDLRCAENAAVPIGPCWLTVAAQEITALGGVTVVVCVTASITGFLALDRKSTSLGFVATVVGGLLISLLLKASFERPRPELVPYLCEVSSSSFPSGHSMMSLVVYASVAVLLAEMAPRRLQKLGLLGITMLLTGLIGASRIYLGVHYPTDVLAGWTAGLVWVTFCWILGQRLERRKTIDIPISD